MAIELSDDHPVMDLAQILDILVKKHIGEREKEGSILSFFSIFFIR